MNKYIQLEEVEKIFQKYIHLAKKNHHKTITIPMFEVVADDLKEIPTIDPIAIIDEMIEEAKKRVDNYVGDEGNDDSEYDRIVERLNTIQELKSRLSLTQK